MQEFINSWWGAIVIGTVVPIVWVLVKRFVKKTETKVDDEIVELVDEVVDTYKAGKEAKSESGKTPADKQAITTPELTKEQRDMLNQ